MNVQDATRTALVTGGTRGIGRGICELLKDRGYNVVAGYAGNTEAAEQFTKETAIPAHRWDVASFDACHLAVAEIADEHGPVTVLVNNAGITRDGTLRKMSYENWMDVIQTNLTSIFNMSKACWEGMMAENFGRIVNMSSINGQAGQYGQVNYCAAKAGILGMTQSLYAFSVALAEAKTIRRAVHCKAKSTYIVWLRGQTNHKVKRQRQ